MSTPASRVLLVALLATACLPVPSSQQMAATQSQNFAAGFEARRTQLERDHTQRRRDVEDADADLDRMFDGLAPAADADPQTQVLERQHAQIRSSWAAVVARHRELSTWAAGATSPTSQDVDTLTRGARDLDDAGRAVRLQQGNLQRRLASLQARHRG